MDFPIKYFPSGLSTRVFSEVFECYSFVFSAGIIQINFVWERKKSDPVFEVMFSKHHTTTKISFLRGWEFLQCGSVHLRVRFSMSTSVYPNMFVLRSWVFI